MALLALLAGCAALCGSQLPPAEQAPPAPSQATPPVSVERLQERLQRTPALQLPPEPKPDFRASVTEDFVRPETILEALRRELSGDVYFKRRAPTVGTTPPLIAVDVLQMAMALKRHVSAALRARAERNARAEVAAALAEFCAAHDCSVLEQPDGDTTSEGVLTR